MSILLTAFQPFGPWNSNASWLVLQEFARELPPELDITTRLYPVDFEALEALVARDVTREVELVLHLGQAAGSTAVLLEQFAVNIRREFEGPSDEAEPLFAGGTAAVASSLPLGDAARRIRDGGVPCEVSFHAGSYVCNAVYYLSLQAMAALGKGGRAAFVHLPLTTEQAIAAPQQPSLPVERMADALRTMVELFATVRVA